MCAQTEKCNGPLKGLTVLQCEGARETTYFGIEYVRVHQSEGCTPPVFMSDISQQFSGFCLYRVSSRVNRT